MLLMLRGKTLGSVLDLLVRLLLLWLLLGIGSGGTGWGGGRVTLGMRVATLIHSRVFAIPFLEGDQHVHVQLREKLGGQTRVWGRELFREVKQLGDIVPCTGLMSLRRGTDD